MESEWKGLTRSQMRFEFITVVIYDHVISFLTFRQETVLEHMTKNVERFEEKS